MGSIVNSLIGGVSGNTGGAGMNYQAGSANLQNPTTVDQANQQYANVQQGLANQNAFLQAVQAQNGLQNQSNVYNQMQGIANGTGPNPAQAALNQGTAANIAAQNAMMAGQRGTSANTGLLARQAAMQGANTQQQAVGQGATLQAQQQLNAMNSMGNLATQQANQQANATNAYTNAALGAQSQVLGGIQGQNQSAVSNMASQNSANAGIAGQVAQQQGNVVGGTIAGAGKALMMMADGGVVTPMEQSQGATNAPQSRIAQFFNQALDQQPITATPNTNQQMYQGGFDLGQGMVNGMGKMFKGSGGGSSAATMGAGGLGQYATAAVPMANGGTVPALLSPGEKYLSPAAVQQVANGDKAPMQAGKTVPGDAKVKGAKNSYANDTVPAQLEEGGIVLPRSVTQHKNAPQKAKEFVAAILAQNHLKKK